MYLESLEPPGKLCIGSAGPPLGIISPQMARPHPICNVNETLFSKFNNLLVTAVMESLLTRETSNPLFTCSEESDPVVSNFDPILNCSSQWPKPELPHTSETECFGMLKGSHKNVPSGCGGSGKWHFETSQDRIIELAYILYLQNKLFQQK
jgi:hypothetical protein